MKRLALTLMLFASMASAAPDTSIRPVARAPLILEQTGTIVAPARTAAGRAAAERGQGVAGSLRPQPRTRKLERTARRQQTQQAKLRAKGAICGDPDIQGDVLGSVPSETRGCGLNDAVQVRSVAGIDLSEHAVMDCATATALKTWVERSAKPTFKRTGGGLRSLHVAGHYVCRTRNHQTGARISEHGRGKAVDISGFKMRDGTTITVLDGWNARGSAKALRRLHTEACGTFGTVLGPQSDRHHRDHFHFDTARHGSGAFCR